MSNESNFSNYVSRLRPIIKIATRDYTAINSLAKSISNSLAITDKVLYLHCSSHYFLLYFQISEDTNLLTPSTYCRVVIEVFDEINFLIDSFGMIQSSQIESSIRSLTFGTDKVVLALNDEKANLNYFDEADTLKVRFIGILNQFILMYFLARKRMVDKSHQYSSSFRYKRKYPWV